MAETARVDTGRARTEDAGWHVDLKWYTACRWILGTWLKLHFRIHEHGLANVPPTGAAILVANHQSWLDPWLFARPLKRTIHWFTKIEWYRNPITGHVLRELGQIPVDRDQRDARAIKTALHVLREGYLLGIFPEGTRSTTGEMLAMRTGAVRLAEKTNVPIIPAAVSGTARLMPRGTVIPRPGVVHLYFGRPYRLSELYGPRLDEAARADAIEDMRRRIAALMQGERV